MSLHNMDIQVTVIPRASRNEVKRQEDGTCRVYTTSPPVDGKANAQVIALLSKEFGVAKSLIGIVKGQNSKRKTVHIEK